ncbi:MAG: LamG-like jellyroll fold domain-containing protein [bacterium]
MMYTQDHEESLPLTSTVWNDIKVDPGVLICPTKGKTITNGYVYYGCMGGQSMGSFSNPSAAGLTADGQHISTVASDLNIAYSGADLDFRHSNKVVAGFVDGHVIASDTPPPPVYGLSATNQRIWYAADAICGVASGTGVQNWVDMGSLNRTVTQPTAANRPTFMANAINGKPALSFNGASTAAASNWLATPQQFDLTGGSNSITMFMVITLGATQNNYTDLMDFDHGTAPNNGCVLQMKDGTPVNSYCFTYSSDGSNFPTWTNTNICTLTASQPQLLTVIQDTSLRYYINGVLKTTYNSVTAWNNGANVLTIGNFTSDHTRCFNGLIAEFAFYNKAMTDTERQAAESYLKGKYGL